jgi:RNA polymerase sigma factor for flagellar operon FliA
MLHEPIDVPMRRPDSPHHYGSGQTQDEILRQHSEMVRRIAWHVFSRMSSSIELEDLVQTGLIALIEAARSYEDRGFAFATYASTRVRGAMIDQLRKEARMTRSGIVGRRKLAETRAALEQQLMREPTSEEMAQAMGIDADSYHALVASAQPVESGSIDEHYSDHDGGFADLTENALASLEREELSAILTQCLSLLPQRDAMVLQLYFVEERNLDEIGMILGVGAARICQIKKKAMESLRKLLIDCGIEH